MKSLAYRENSGSGREAIVLIHGGGIASGIWQADLDDLSEYHCLAPDLPSHGRSAAIKPFSLGTAVEGAAELIDSHALGGQASILGVSIGAAVAIELANRHPSKVKRLFLSGPTPRFGKAAVALMNVLSAPLLRLIGPNQRARFVARAMGLSERQIAENAQDLEAITPSLVAEINQAVAEQPDPAPNDRPAVIVVGENELGATKARARHLASAYGNHHVHVVPDGSHTWFVEDPELFRRAVRTWMAGTELPPGFGRLAI